MMQIAQDRGWIPISGVEAMIEQGIAVGAFSVHFLHSRSMLI